MKKKKKRVSKQERSRRELQSAMAEVSEDFKPQAIEMLNRVADMGEGERISLRRLARRTHVG